MIIDTLIISISLVICFYILYQYQKVKLSVLPYKYLALFFLLKLFTALFFLYVYTFHYGGGDLTADAGMFFQESKVLNDVFYENPKTYFQFIFNWNTNHEMVSSYLDATSHWNATERLIPNDSRNVIRINSILLFISNGNIFFHFIVFSFITFFAGLDLAQFIRKHSNFKTFWIVFALTLTPSIAFWGSSIIKEPLLLAGLMLLLRGLFNQLSYWKKIYRIVIGVFLMSLFKPYILFILIPFILLYFLISLIKKYSPILITGIYFLIILIAGQLSGFNNKMLYLISKQQEDFINLRDGGLYLIDDEEHYIYIYYINRAKFTIEDGYATLNEPVGALYLKANENFNRKSFQLNDVGKKWKIGLSLEKTGSGVDATPINNSGIQLIKNIPSAIVNKIVRPYPWDSGSWLKHLAFIENSVLLFFLILGMIYQKEIKNKKIRNVILVLTLFALSILLVVGWTTPVLGAIVRYKVPATLIIVLIILVIWKKKETKLTNRLKLFT